MILTGKKQAEMFRDMIDKVVEVATPKVMQKILEMQIEQEEKSKEQITKQLDSFYAKVEEKVEYIIRKRLEKDDKGD